MTTEKKVISGSIVLLGVLGPSPGYISGQGPASGEFAESAVSSSACLIPTLVFPAESYVSAEMNGILVKMNPFCLVPY